MLMKNIPTWVSIYQDLKGKFNLLNQHDLNCPSDNLIDNN